METDILAGIVQDYENATLGWFDVIFPYAQRLFFGLVVLELIWSAAWWVFERDNPNSVIAALLYKIIAISFMFAILLHADAWIPAIANSFIEVGAAASGLPELNPSTVLDKGIVVAKRVLDPIGTLGFFKAPVATLIGALTALFAVLAFALIAGQMVLALIESYIVIGGGVLMLGFAGSRWTIPFAERFLSYAVSVGTKLFIIYLIMGIGINVADRWGALLTEAAVRASPEVYLQVLGGSLIFALLVWSVPSIASSILYGAVALSVHEAFQTERLAGQTAGDALNAFGTTKATAGKLAAGIGTVAAGTVGTVSAVTAAAQLSSEVSRSEGGGMRGALHGARAGAEALSAEALRAAVPSLGGKPTNGQSDGRSAAQRVREQAGVVRGERLGREAAQEQQFAENVGEIGATAEKPPQGNSPLKIG